MSKYLNTFFSFAFFAFLIAISIILAVDKAYSMVVLEGIKMWIFLVLPSLFPYFFITSCLSNLKSTQKIANFFSPLSKKLFNVSGAVGYAYFMSLLSGYPVGAKIISDLKEKKVISEPESTRAAALCSTSSPMFLLGSVGNIMFNNSLFGFLLFLSHIISSIFIGIIFSFYRRKEKINNPSHFSPALSDNILYESTYSAIISALIVGGMITIFYLLTEVLLAFNILSPFVNLLSFIFNDDNLGLGFSLGIFECTKGLKTISNSGILFLSLPITCSLCGFGGISILMQSLAYLKKAKIKIAPFVFSKILSAILNFLIGCAFSFLFF